MAGGGLLNRESLVVACACDCVQLQEYLHPPSGQKWKKPLRRGLYADQLRVWYEYFMRDQFIILTSDDLYGEPQVRCASSALQHVCGCCSRDVLRC